MSVFTHTHTHTRRALLTAAAAILLITSCGKKEETVGVSSVTVTPSRIEIIEGGSAALSARVSPEAASDRAVAWSSSDRSVATVDKTGTVQGLKPGTATVTATAEGKSGTCTVTVKAKAVNVTEVTLDKTELTLTEGETEALTATVKPDNADNRKVTWSSDKTEVATVDGAGRVTAVKAGEAVVTVTTEDGGKTATCKVTVKAKAVNVTEVTLDKTELTLTEGETETLTATVKPDNADNRKVTWSSDKTEIATVDGAGKVTAVKPGEAVVTVTTEDGGKTATCKVTVKAKTVSVTGVEVNPWAVTLSVRGTSKLSYTIRPADATNQNVKWESESPSVATVDSEGNVQGVAAGTAKICVTTEDGGFKSYCTVTVKKAESKFEVGGLWYEYFYGPNLARVIPDPDGSKYGGNISIPGQIEYGGITYSVYQIGSHAFYECADLKSVTLGEGIEYIDAWAFYNCPNLERITFSSTMNSLNNRNPVFECCPKLEIVTTPKTSESQLYYFYTHDGALYRHCYYSADTGTFDEETEVLSWLPEKTTGVFTIKDGVEVIDSYSLTFTGIDKIIIPESVKYIAPRFFDDSKTPLEIELNWRTKEDIDRISTIESDPSRFFFVHTDRSAVKVTVPKGTKSLYESHWLWSHLGGIEERP
ncbi:MAG: Ig-like domain-containing protein [Alistipes sp.]|nr:Ig-like domain-containing protein [Alistipes sp.]